MRECALACESTWVRTSVRACVCVRAYKCLTYREADRHRKCVDAREHAWVRADMRAWLRACLCVCVRICVHACVGGCVRACDRGA